MPNNKRIAVVIAGAESPGVMGALTRALGEAGAAVTKFAAGAINGLRTAEFDGIVLVGDFDSDRTVVEKLILEFSAQQNPIATIGRAGLVVASTMGRKGVTLTIGHDETGEVAKSGAYHETCADDDFITDREHRIISTPGNEVGIRKAIQEFVEMA